MQKCLYAGTLTLPPQTKSKLASSGIDLVENPYRRSLTEDDLVSLLGEFDAVLAGPEPYTARVIQSTQKLKIIARTGVGFDKVDLQAATNKGIYVTWTPVPELSASIAEHTIALILAELKRIPQLSSAIREGKWERQKWSAESRDLNGLTLGLFGLGRIGSEVAKRAKAFGVTVVYYDVIRMQNLEEDIGINYVTFDKLLSDSDVLSIHSPLTAETRGIIDERAIGKMKRTAIIVNTARGGIVDERALAKALEEERLAGAALDVLSEEPPSQNHVFYKLGDRLPNLILTGHSGIGDKALQAMVYAACEDVIRVLRGAAPKYLLNKELSR